VPEDAQPGWDITAKTAGNTVGPAVTAMMTAFGVAHGVPDAAVAAVPTGAFAGAVTEQGVSLIRRLWNDRFARVVRFSETVAAISGSVIEEILQEAQADPEKLELLADAVAAAARSRDASKIDLLARIFVSGLRDDAKVDESVVLIAALSQLEAVHIRVLAVVAQFNPFAKWTANLFKGALNRDKIAKQLPELTPILDGLLAKLQAVGLVYQDMAGEFGRGEWMITQFGAGAVGFLADR
jgi:hypothetical protein